MVPEAVFYGWLMDRFGSIPFSRLPQASSDLHPCAWVVRQYTGNAKGSFQHLSPPLTLYHLKKNTHTTEDYIIKLKENMSSNKLYFLMAKSHF